MYSNWCVSGGGVSCVRMMVDGWDSREGRGGVNAAKLDRMDQRNEHALGMGFAGQSERRWFTQMRKCALQSVPVGIFASIR